MATPNAPATAPAPTTPGSHQETLPTPRVNHMTEFTRAELRELHADFEAAQRRPLKIRLRSAFIRTYKPVLDDGTIRMFNTTREYRQWCNETLPDWLGYRSSR